MRAAYQSDPTAAGLLARDGAREGRFLPGMSPGGRVRLDASFPVEADWKASYHRENLRPFPETGKGQG